MDYEVIAKEIFLDTGPLEAKCKFVSSRVMRIAVADGNTPAIANIWYGRRNKMKVARVGKMI